MSRVVVITGHGGMGQTVARRLGSGAVVLLADLVAPKLASVAEQLRDEGYQVVEHVTDVSDASSVAALAAAAAELGRVEILVHTAGVSPVHASVESVLKVDLLGTALMLDAFCSVMAPGGAGVFIASMAGSLSPLDPDLERQLVTTPTEELLALPKLSRTALTEPGAAYGLAKRANQLRVRAASVSWGRQQARVNSVSPGIISTAMGVAELDGPHGEAMHAMIGMSPAGRIGTASDIAAAVEFLAGEQSTFITGTDLLVDGGVTAAVLGYGH